MTEADKEDYWEKMSERGEQEGILRQELDTLLFSYDKTDSSEILNKKTSTIKKAFLSKVKTEIDKITSKYSLLNPKDIQTIKKRFKKSLFERIELVHTKKAFCKILFPSYPLFKLIEVFSSLVSTVEFKTTDQNIDIVIMDPRRICLMQLLIRNKGYKFFKEGKLCIDLDSFKNVLKCQESDKSETTLIFGESSLYITLKSKKYNSVIKRTLEPYGDLEINEPPIETLSKIVYPFEFHMLPTLLEFTLRNSDLYSEIVKIQANEQNIIFSESGQIGEGQIIWKKKDLNKLIFHSDLIEFQLKQDNLGKKDKKLLEKIQAERTCFSDYAVSFLRWIGKTAKILDKNDIIRFFIRNDHPLKVQMDFKKLGQTNLTYYLSCSVEEADFDEDEEDEESAEF